MGLLYGFDLETHRSMRRHSTTDAGYNAQIIKVYLLGQLLLPL